VVEDFSRAYLIFIQTMPTIVLIVLLLIFLGSTPSAVVAVTVASCFTYFTLNIIQGTKAVDSDLVEMAHTYGASELTIMRSIILPSLIPYVLAAGRVAIGVAWQVTLFTEYLMGVKGIGFQLQSYIGLSQTANVYSWGIIVVLLTIFFEYALFRPIESVLTRHTRRAS
jgi:NitT/TauT family transport system permease protein